MDSLIAAAARALAAGDALGALKRVALRGDPAALALRGIAMAQLGELSCERILRNRHFRRIFACRCRSQYTISIFKERMKCVHAASNWEWHS
jgi:hypothetical protein